MVKNPLQIGNTGRADAFRNSVPGEAGYDNSRENIDPFVKTKVLSTQEIFGKSAVISGNISGSNLFAVNAISGAKLSSINSQSVTNANAQPLVEARLTHSSSNSSTTTGYGYYLQHNISGTDTTAGFGGKRSYGYFVDMNNTSIVNNANNVHQCYGVYSDVSFSGTITDSLGVDTTAGYFTSTGNMGTNGVTSHYGLNCSVSGTADTNFGVFSDVLGASINWAFYANSGNSFLGNDNVKTFWGTGVDCSIFYDGTNMVIAPQEIGSGYLKVSGALLVVKNISGSNLFSTNSISGANLYSSNNITAKSRISGATIFSSGGFTGSGLFTNLTISGGIIIAAS